MIYPKSLLLHLFTLFILGLQSEGIGVHIGTQMQKRLPIDAIEQSLDASSIKTVRLLDTKLLSRSSFKNKEVVVGIPYEELSRLGDDKEMARLWVEANITAHTEINFKYVAMGDEQLSGYKQEDLLVIHRALKNIQAALNYAGIGNKTKAIVPLTGTICSTPTSLPSDGDFRADIKGTMLRMVKQLHRSNAPFAIKIHPFIALHQNPKLETEFAFFDSKAETHFRDRTLNYTNMFDVVHDTLVWSMRKAGFSNQQILVVETGWPTDGAKFANVDNALRFYNGLFKKIASGHGTPVRRGPMEVYIYSFMDENEKRVETGGFERHWGIFQYDGKPKFPMDLSGKGNLTWNYLNLTVQYYPFQWCVLSRDIVNIGEGLVGSSLDMACKQADCSSLDIDSSCGNLSYTNKISYAFNALFQKLDQDVTVCNFEGLGEITYNDPSQASCRFTVQINRAGTNLLPGLPTLASFFVVWFLFLRSN